MVTNDEGRAAREAKLEYLHDTLATTVEALVSAEDWVRAPGPRAEVERHQQGVRRPRVPEAQPHLATEGRAQWSLRDTRGWA